VGGTATRWSLVDGAGDVKATGEAPGFSASSALPDSIAVAEDILSSIRKQLGQIQAITAGITGLSRGSDMAAALARVMANIFEVRDVSLMSDIELQCRAHFKQGEGILVYSGTGSVAGHVTHTGRLETAGGKGVRIDDAGGSYWIAAYGLRTILRLEDREFNLGWGSPMGQSMALMLGSSDWATVKSRIASMDRGAFATLARAVADGARKSDPLALGILRTAGAELALLADMLVDRIGRHAVVLTGRAAELHPEIVISMREALPHCRVEQKFMEASAVAARLAFSGSE
jgi:glucosamine kinase